MKKTYQHLAVIGSGAWGTALSVALGNNFETTTLIAREKEVCYDINNKRMNQLYLKDVILDPPPFATQAFDTLSKCDLAIFVTPAQFFRNALEQAKPYLSNDTPIIIASKGIEISTGKLLTNVLEETCPEIETYGVLMGPTFAKDVVIHKPSAITLALNHKKNAEKLLEKLATKTFRPYLSYDIIGAQVGAAIKNVLAIGCGIVAGKNLGENAKAAIITRGITEILTLNKILGGKSETILGLSGVGDIVLTCTSTTSRNFSLGYALGQGVSIEDYIASKNSVAEGYYTTKAIKELTKKLRVELPIIDSIYNMLYLHEPVDLVIEQLLSRPLKTEFNDQKAS